MGLKVPHLLSIQRLDTSTAIAVYKQLAPQVFRPGLLGQVGKLAKATISKPWFKAEALEKAIKSIVKERIPSDEKEARGKNTDFENAKLLRPTAENQDSACKMYSPRALSCEKVVNQNCSRFVCAWNVEDHTTTLFRNYRPTNESQQSCTECTIWEAALATSAAPFYFPEAHVGGKTYWDGAVENNNPIDEVWTEKGIDPARCVVSLGTGVSERKERKGLGSLGRAQRLVKILTQTETNHKRYQGRLAELGIPYYRFNPTTNQDDIKLDEYKKLDALEEHTKNYLAEEQVAADIRACARVLIGLRATEDELSDSTC